MLDRAGSRILGKGYRFRGYRQTRSNVLNTKHNQYSNKKNNDCVIALSVISSCVEKIS